MVEIPIVLANINKGAKRIFIDSTRLPYFLNLNNSDIETLQREKLIESTVSEVIPKSKINYGELAAQYKQKIDNGEYPNRAELARSIGVSRAWITIVFKKAKTYPTLSFKGSSPN